MMLLLSHTPRLSLLICLLLSALPAAIQGQQPAPSQQPGRYTQLAEGILASTEPVFATDSIPRYHVEVRDLILGPNQNAPKVPLSGFTLMELRSGVVETTDGGKAVRRETGSVWLVARGAQLSIRNLSEAAVIRATSLVPR